MLTLNLIQVSLKKTEACNGKLLQVFKMLISERLSLQLADC